MSISKSNKSGSDWKKTFTVRITNRLANDLNNVLKQADKDTPNTLTWLNSAASKAKDNQLEVETDKYTYTAARNGSKEVGIQESDIAATLSADEYNSNRQTFEREYKYKSKCP